MNCLLCSAESCRQHLRSSPHTVERKSGTGTGTGMENVLIRLASLLPFSLSSSSPSLSSCSTSSFSSSSTIMRHFLSLLATALLFSASTRAAPISPKLAVRDAVAAQTFTDSPAVVQTNTYGSYVGLHLPDVQQDQVRSRPCVLSNLILSDRPPSSSLRSSTPSPTPWRRSENCDSANPVRRPQPRAVTNCATPLRGGDPVCNRSEARIVRDLHPMI